VHGAEISTDQEMLGPYAETIAMLVALVALAAAAWAVAVPSSTADLPPATSAAPAAPEVYAVNRTAGSTADVLWADAFDAPAATAVTVITPTAASDDPVDATSAALR
jgi:hypothetical protein